MTDSSSIYDPALRVTVPAVDVREAFGLLSETSAVSDSDLKIFAGHKAAWHSLNASRQDQQPIAAADDGHSRAIGFWPIEGQMVFTNSTSIRYVIVFPDSVGGDF